jgi:hypothetical protein
MRRDFAVAPKRVDVRWNLFLASVMARLIGTIGQAVRHGMLARIECMHCRHVGFHKASELARAVGFGRAFDDIRFKCSRCERRNAKVRPMEIDHDRPPKVMVWTLTRLRL